MQDMLGELRRAGGAQFYADAWAISKADPDRSTPLNHYREDRLPVHGIARSMWA